MSWSNWKGFNFRDTAGYVTDGTDEIPILGASNATYPASKTIDGDTFDCGWLSGDAAGGNSRDRNSGVDRRCAGTNFEVNNGAQKRFRVDLPATGDYEIRLAIGDASNGSEVFYRILDDTTVLATYSKTGGDAPAAGEFYDASGVKRSSAADWASNNATATLTFATTTLFVSIGFASGGTATGLCHLAIRQAAPAVTREQTRYRWRNDDGSETGATWAAAENTNLTAPLG